MAKSFISVNTNVKKLLADLTKELKTIHSLGPVLTQGVAREFVTQARQRLVDSGYKVENLTHNIVVKEVIDDESGEYSCKIGWRDGISSEERDIMYFLEFGTGIVGDSEPHELAGKVGWEYIMYPENLASNHPYGYNRYIYPTGYNSLNEDVGMEGWYYRDPHDGVLSFTSGLKAVSYLYDTMRPENLDRIVNKVYKTIKWK